MSTKYWDPRAVLDINPEEPRFTCVGKALSKSGQPRCGNLINANDRSEAQYLLQSLAAKPLKSNHERDLISLACVTLCPHWHREARPAGDRRRPRIPQVSNVVATWSYNIQMEIKRRVQEKKISSIEVYRETELSTDMVSVSSSLRMAQKTYKPVSSNVNAFVQRSAEFSFRIASDEDPFVSRPNENSRTKTNFLREAAAPTATPTSPGQIALIALRDASERIAANSIRRAGAPLSDKTNTTRVTTKTRDEKPLETLDTKASSSEDREPSIPTITQMDIAKINLPASSQSSSKPTLARKSDPESKAENLTGTVKQESLETNILTTQITRPILKPKSRKISSPTTPIREIKPEKDLLETVTWEIKQETKAESTGILSSSTKQIPAMNLTISKTTIIHSIPPSTPTHTKFPIPSLTPPSSGQPKMKSLPTLPISRLMINPPTPPSFDVQNLIALPSKQKTPSKSRVAMTRDPATPVSRILRSEDGTPNSTAPLIQSSSSQISPSSSPSPIPEKRAVEIKTTQIDILPAASTEVLIEPVYCRGECGALIHGGWRGIWRSGEGEAEKKGLVGWWGRVKCSFWWVVERVRGIGFCGMRRSKSEGDDIV